MNRRLRRRLNHGGGVTVVRFGAMLMAMTAAAFAVPASAAIDLERAPAGMVVRSTDARCADIAAAASPCGAAGTDMDLMFVDPGHPERKGSTAFFSIDVDAGSKAMVTAYDASGRLLGVADRGEDAGGSAERLILAGLGDIARVHISGRGPVAVQDLSFAEVKTGSHLPEPATWLMLFSGFLLMAAVIRRRIRVSEARFTEQVRRIAAGGSA